MRAEGRDRRRAQYWKNPRLKAFEQRLRTYRITAAQFLAMRAEQEGKCAACRVPIDGKNEHVDHCHVTGKVRALLCHYCNATIGFSRDDPWLLRTLADYLEAHGAQPQRSSAAVAAVESPSAQLELAMT